MVLPRIQVCELITPHERNSNVKADVDQKERGAPFWEVL